ncbi:DEKNAAC102430 [Brettanomyces naardenensis]|uniref:Type 1 phosphatases regulator n=1 Tax=Brettanomyces naardenensis TaxID=13370 RepID=A0A448YLF1_BRENA|nr:DEKNAAC102430 [Brettanomyces naardenensis]
MVQIGSSGGSQQQYESGSHTVTIPRVELPTLHLVPTTDKDTKKKKEGKGRKVKWKEGVIDNEHMNKKKTKICCIFHPQDDSDFECDSSDSDSSSSSSSSDSDSDNEDAKGSTPQKQKPTEPNAYEKQPKYRRKKPLPVPAT